MDTINYYRKELYFKCDKVPESTSGIVLTDLQPFYHKRFYRNFPKYAKVPKLPTGARKIVLHKYSCGRIFKPFLFVFDLYVVLPSIAIV